MNPLSLWVLWLIAVEATAQLTPRAQGRVDRCKNLTLPWTVPRESFEDVPDSVFETLMRCPERLHGCSEELVSCRRATYAATCSCASNCKAYRDCCWDVPFSTFDAEIPVSGCVEVYLDSSWKKFVYMVVGCLQSWPYDDIRDSCEQPQNFNDTFYLIPVTSANHVTYRNAFCAICNDDFGNTIFWNATRYKTRLHRVLVTLPHFVENNPTLHLRPCRLDNLNDSCTRPVSTLISKRCETYYAPVQDKGNPYSLVYRNVYCAMCSGANLTALSCSQTLHLSNFSAANRRKSGGGVVPDVFRPPNLAGLFKPVVSTSTCYAEHDGHCYIRRLPSFYRKEPRSRKGPTGGEASPLPPVRTPKKRNYYRAHHYVTVISLLMSICCLVLKVVVFCMYPNVRSFSSKCTLCLSVTILLTHLLFLISSCFALPPHVCIAAAVLQHYGFLSTFFWTSVLSYDIWRGVTAMKLYSTRRKTLVLYGVLAWGLPLVIVAAAVTVDWAAPDSILSAGYGHAGCWIGTMYGLIVYFLVPMATLLLFCVCFYLKTVCYIRNTTLAAGSLQEPAKCTRVDVIQQKQRRSQMSLFTRLALIMGAAWAVAFIGIFVPIAEFDYVTNALVGCQGVYMFLAFKDYHYLCSCGNKCANMTRLNGSPRTSRSDLTSSKKSSGSKST